MLGVAQLPSRIDDEDTAEQPAQAELFQRIAANTNAPRIRPDRALIKFSVRRDVDHDVPLARPKQLGLEDASVDRLKLARGVQHGEPLSERAILRIVEGSDQSGHRRKTFTTEVNETVESFFHASQALYGLEQAVCMTFSLVSRAPTYMRDNPPSWLLRLFAEERALLMHTFHDGAGDRRIELGESGEDDE